MKCTACGAVVEDKTATFCGYCGNSVKHQSPVPVPVASKHAQAYAPPVDAGAEDAPLTDFWRDRFAVIQKAGGPNLTRGKELTSGERFKLFNWWGLLFGPFYYLYLGIPKKALTLGLACIAAIFIVDEFGRFGALVSNFIVPAVFGGRATTDYYKKIVMKDNEWW